VTEPNDETRAFFAALSALGGDAAGAKARLRIVLAETGADPFGLTPIERLAIWCYTTFNVWHLRINRELWSGEVSRATNLLVTVIERAARKLPRFEGPSFRGLNDRDFAADSLERYGVGRIVTWPGFSSSSRTPELAYRGNLLFQIFGRNGRSLQGYSADHGEQEVLFLPSTRFVILQVSRSADGRIVIEAQEFV